MISDPVVMIVNMYNSIVNSSTNDEYSNKLEVLKKVLSQKTVKIYLNSLSSEEVDKILRKILKSSFDEGRNV